MAATAVITLIATLCVYEPTTKTRDCEDVLVATNQFQTENTPRFSELSCLMLGPGLIAKYLNDHQEKYGGKKVSIIKWGCPREKRFDI